MKKIILTVLLMFISTTVTLGQEEWELPRSWQERDLRPIEKVEVLEHLSDSVIKYWDDYWETREFQLWAYPHYLNYTLENSGQWETLKDGSKVWRLAIVIPKDIELLNIYFDTFLMAKDSKFYIWSYSNKELIDNISYEKKQKQREQRLAVEKKLDTKLDSTWETKHGTVINKKLDTLIFEYNIPYRVLDIGKISLHGLNEQRPKNIGLNTTNNNDCHVNVNCIEGYDWHKEKNAVVKIIVNDVSSFTGALVNNTDNDYIPYVLTTKHAIDELSKLSEPISITSLKFQWNYDSDTCGEDVFLHTSVITGGGAILIASTETENNSDFVLLLLNEDPKDVAGIDLYYLGWDSNESIGNTGVGIHHPKGKTKKIATVKQNSIVSDLNHNYWRVQWEETVNGYDITENFSSGSPLLNENHRVIGQLRGGTLIVKNICDSAVYKKSYYGKFSVSWDNDTSISKQLKYWLDPNNTNVSVCDGTEYFPCLVGKSPFLTNRIITGNVSINTPIYSAGDITIKNGGTLNITSTLYMAPNTQIIVERGGQLNVTNGTITNACENEYWAGVEVQGS
ncbi:MAG: hypothetical protein IJ180_05055, partial [Bacteroidales bacterium]|nr:hypothetical protein [Bacteroidales bacterium]